MIAIDEETWREAHDYDKRRDEAGAKHRKDFPGMLRMLTIFKASAPRAVWCEENGKTIGRIPQ